MISIIFKEINEFFRTFIGYITIAFFLILTGGVLWINPKTNLLYSEIASLQFFFDFCPYALMLLIAALTMNSWAKEKNSGMIEILLTSPVKTEFIVLGKFFANILIIMLCIFLTFPYYITLYFLGIRIGNLDSASIFGSYLGLLLLSGAFTSIGICASNLSRNTVVCFFINICLFFIYFKAFEMISNIERLKTFSDFFYKISASSYYFSLGRGLIDTRDIVFFLISIFICIYSTKYLLRKLRN